MGLRRRRSSLCLHSPSIKQPDAEQVIFTRYLAAEHPEGVWKEYNEVNAAVNADAWLNEMMPEFLPWVKTHPVYTKSVYSSFAVPEVVKAAKKAAVL